MTRPETQQLSYPASPKNGLAGSIGNLSVSERLQARTELEFVYCTHTDEYAKGVLQAVEAADVVAIEYILPRKDSEQAETLANLATTTNPEIDLTDLRAESNDFVYTIVDGLRGTGKPIYFIDVREEEYNELTKKRDAISWQQLQDAAFSLSTEKIKSLLERQVLLETMTARRRESVVSSQIDELIRQYPAHKIAVVEGAFHTPTSHIPREDTVHISRKFIPTGEKHKFSYSERGPGAVVYRTKRFNPFKPSPAVAMDLFVVEYYLDTCGNVPLTDLDIDKINAAQILQSIDNIILSNTKITQAERKQLVSDFLLEIWESNHRLNN